MASTAAPDAGTATTTTPAAAAATAAAAAAAVQRSLDKIQAQLEAGSFYEAQQMYKTVYARYRSRRQLPEAYAVLRAGAVQQLRSRQVNCGLELATMLLDAYTADKQAAAPGSEPLAAVFAVVAALPDNLGDSGGSSSSSAAAAAAAAADGGTDAAASSGASAPAELDEAGRFIAAALKWVHKTGADADVQRLHDAYAGWVLRAFGWRQLGRAALHFSRGADAGAYADALLAVADAAGGGEEDLFAARAALQALACAHPSTRGRQLRHAADVLEACLARRPALREAPLARFAGLLLQAVGLNKRRLVALLRAHYAPSLARDAALGEYLDAAEAAYFGAPAGSGAAGGGGLLGGLLRSMLLEGDEMDE